MTAHDGIVVPGKFGTPHSRARQALSEDLARLIVPFMNDLGWQTVCNDLLNVAASFIAQGSQKPAHDLSVAARFVAKYDWRRAKKLYFAAMQGVRPEQIQEEPEPEAEKPIDENDG